MTSQDNFKDFYNNSLVPDLTSLELTRKKIYVGLVVFFALFLILVFISVFFLGGFHEFSLTEHTNKNFIVSLLILVFWAVIGVLIYKKLFDKKLGEIRSNFKRSIIDKIVVFVDPKLTYIDHKMISKQEYIDSKIYPIEPKVFRGEDYMVGSEGDISYKFSELHARVYLKDHRGRKAFYTLFHGLFFIADFHRDFGCETIILPDTAHKLFGRFGDFVQKHNIFRDKVIAVEDKEFSKEFVVYGNSQEGSDKILSQALLKRITDFKVKSGHKVYLSLIGSKLNVAIPLEKDLFEPPIFGSMLNYDTIEESYRYLKLLTGIVNDLDPHT